MIVFWQRLLDLHKWYGVQTIHELFIRLTDTLTWSGRRRCLIYRINLVAQADWPPENVDTHTRHQYHEEALQIKNLSWRTGSSCWLAASQSRTNERGSSIFGADDLAGKEREFRCRKQITYDRSITCAWLAVPRLLWLTIASAFLLNTWAVRLVRGL